MLIPVIISLATLIATLEYASHLSERDGGVFFALGDLPARITFVYLYLPAIIVVILSISWSWIDLDARRLEAFFQMSKAEGSTFDNLIDLQYSFDYIAVVPFKAFRRG